MTRTRSITNALIYGERQEPVAHYEGIDPDTPVAGFYKMKLRSGAMHVGVKIWFGPPLDPIDGTELDRSHRWQAEVNGRPFDLLRAWPSCAKEPSNEGEYRYLTSLQAWGEEHAPDSPQANPTRRVDLLTAPLPF